MEQFIVEKNQFLNSDVVGYYRFDYVGHRNEGNPDFLNDLKNLKGNEFNEVILAAQAQVVEIIQNDIKTIIDNYEMSNCVVTTVPRAKPETYYRPSQQKFREAVSIGLRDIDETIDGVFTIIRISETQTTHLPKNDFNLGERPYPGITLETCDFNTDNISGKNVILVDDIYTKNVNIDEDCIQALFDLGAASVVFYAVAKTRQKV